MDPRSLAALALAMGFCTTAHADEIRLANGDRITGTVVAKTGEHLVVSTGYAGRISVQWAQVASVQTDAPVEVLRGKQPLRGRLVREDDGVALEDATGARHPIELEEIAFINPQPHESGSGTTYSGRVAFSASQASGNADSERLYVDGQLTARALEYGFGLTAKAERRSDTEVGTHTAALLGANYDRFVDTDEFAYARGSLERDRAKDIEQRTTVGVGYGLHLVDRPGAKLTVRGGVDHVQVDRFVAAAERYPALGWGVEATYSPWGGPLELFHSQDGFMNLEDTGNVLVRSRTGVRVPLVERLSATAQLNIDWERRPPPGRVPTDRTLLLGVDYAF